MQTIVTWTIRRDEAGDYVVRFRKYGERMPEWDYFTDDKADAIGTALYVERQWNHE
jgi:hypothetical protein